MIRLIGFCASHLPAYRHEQSLNRRGGAPPGAAAFITISPEFSQIGSGILLGAITSSRERQLDLPAVLHRDLRNGEILNGKSGRIKDGDRILT